MLHTLRHANAMTAQRDRAVLEISFAQAVRNLLDVPRVAVHRLYCHHRQPLVGMTTQVDQDGVQHEDDDLGWPQATVALAEYPLLNSALDSEQPISAVSANGQHQSILAIPRNGQTFGLVDIAHLSPLNPEQLSLLMELVALYSNCLALLDYSEVDTLTGLLNRKTFDEKLIKILTCLNLTGDNGRHSQLNLPLRRSGHGDGKQHWLAVLDIDYFKRVNDNFGHSIGDEVLLLAANLMKKSFRGEDKLFRFGGEEFVVVLKPCTRHNAVGVFERFRNTMARFAFPQVGHVTISTGFAHISRGDTPSQVLDAADEALYYAKTHGRDQVQNYETLLESGELARKEVSMAVDLF